MEADVGRCAYCAEPLDPERLERLRAVEAPLVCPDCVDRIDPVALVQEAAAYAGVDRNNRKEADREARDYAVRTVEATTVPTVAEALPDLDWTESK